MKKVDGIDVLIGLGLAGVGSGAGLVWGLGWALMIVGGVLLAIGLAAMMVRWRR